ncbi:MAG: HAD-IIIA family hydrolase [Proteobacteria bacterium]|jgi:3-deoxy-D-manno-octulosonate 8-phosphate phosphatase (KDO 8-P phosphatase)|nr:HAD-IIIA family hydrolase [Pseudomonadota bacterium]
MGREKARDIKLLILDVDGVLTDGKIVYTDRGEEAKAFDVKDGHGLKLLMRAGIPVALITGRSSPAVEHRARDLGITRVYQKAINKIEAYEELRRAENLRDEEICVVGDDLPDLPILRICGFSVAVADSAEEVKREVDYVTNKEAGKGAVREVCDIILKARGLWGAVTDRYF